jgi:hypothetical protein
MMLFAGEFSAAHIPFAIYIWSRILLDQISLVQWVVAAAVLVGFGLSCRRVVLKKQPPKKTAAACGWCVVFLLILAVYAFVLLRSIVLSGH